MAPMTHGYRPDFLPALVSLPHPVDGRSTVELPYIHFTVLLDPARRLAASTGVNIDGAALLDLDRADDWHLDPRVPATAQAGEELYSRNDLDRGHLVRRRDPVWGPRDVAAAANDATFVFTNAAPQAAPFNQGPHLWVGLEDHVLEFARAYEQKVSVFTGPVLAEDDIVYRGIQIPRRFWKIAAWTSVDGPGGPELRSAGFVLDQGPSLDDIALSSRAPAVGEMPPPLGPFLTYQVPVSDIGELTGLARGPLAGGDRFEAVESTRTTERWNPIESRSDVKL